MSRLRLKKERLAELTTEELHRVQGAGADAAEAATKPLRDCAHTVFGCTTAITCPRPE